MKKLDRRVMSGTQIVLTVLCAFLALVFIAMIFVTAYANHYLGLIQKIPNTTVAPNASGGIDLTETMPSGYTGPTVDPTEITVPKEEVVLIQHEDLINILLVGQDRRPGEGRQRSDSMIVVSINTKDNSITLTSFMRDMYVQIPGYKGNKMNAAYAKGGFPMLCATLKENFGVVIDGCVEVDFDGFTNIVDVLGGVDIKLTQAEANHLNECYGFSLTAGVNHLNGEEALGYARIRHLAGSDFARTERQRTVINAILEECRNASLTELMALLEHILPQISTDMSNGQILKYLGELAPMISGTQIKELRIPANGTYEDAFVSGAGDSLIPDLKKNRQILVDALMPG